MMVTAIYVDLAFKLVCGSSNSLILLYKNISESHEEYLKIRNS